MGHPYHHALSSARKWGGKPEDYLALHNWFDSTKSQFADFRHRALRHHSEGIFMAEHEFGTTITNSLERKVPTRVLAEQHVIEDLGRIPTVADWLRMIKPERWMGADVQQLSMEELTEEQKQGLQAYESDPANKLYTN